MNIVTWRDIQRANTESIKDLLPCIVTVQGVPTFMLGSYDKTVALDDLHVRVQAMIRNIERRARAGMPPPTQTIIKPSDVTIDEDIAAKLK